MYGAVKAIAIDDEPSHLLAVTTALSALGVPAIGHWYDRDSADLQPAPPPGGHKHLRLVFTDLNLSELGGVPDPEALWATIVSVLKQVVSVDSGPYLLIFWTRIEATASIVKGLLYGRSDQLGGVPLPLEIVEIAKAPFLVSMPGAAPFDEQMKGYFDELHSRMDQFKAEVAKAITVDKQLSLVAAWEARAAEAASSAVNEVARCARIEAGGDSARTSESIAITLSRIAIAAAGNHAAEKNPGHSLDAGLIDIAADKFGASVVDESYRRVVSDSISQAVANDTAFSRPVEMNAELNTFFHVDRTVDRIGSLDRGAVIYARTVGNNLGSFRPMKYLDSEFFYPAEIVAKGNEAVHKADMTAIRDSKSAVFVELGADCDHAQANQRTNRFLLGFLVSESSMYLIKSEGRLRSGALELLGPWMVGGERKYLLVSCRRYWTWQDSTLAPSEVAFRLRSPVVEKLLHRYASWSSRPGIIEFR